MKIYLYNISRKSIIFLLVLSFFSFSKAADITVSNTNNSGAGSLRQAIIDANLTTASDNIIFDMPGTAVRTITLLSELPQIIYPVNINGYSKVNSSAGPIGSRNILIEINCGNVENITDIFYFADTAGGSSISGLAIYNKGIGSAVIRANSINGLHIWGNYFGTRANGTASNATLMRSTAIIYIGSHTQPTATNNLIIGTNGDNTNDANEGNVFANSQTSLNGMGNGIMLDGDGGGLTLTNSRIAGNYIGLEADGTTLAPIGQGTNNARGIGVIFYRATCTNMFIGTNADGVSDSLERNIISGCNTYGIEVEGGSGISIAGNYIGTDKTGTISKPNALSNPLYVAVYLQHRGGVYPVENISIGFDDRIHDASDAVNVRNIISGNYGRGVGIASSTGATGPRTSNIIIAGNYIGVDVTGNTALPNGMAGPETVAATTRAGIGLIGVINSRIGTNSNGSFDELERNVISGNVNGAGLYLSSTNFATENNIIAGNYIGIGANGTTPIGNGQAGIYLQGTNGTYNNRIGSNDDGTRDAIEANISANNGKLVSATVNGGVNLTGNSIQNRISRNIFYNNGGLPIDLGNNGVTPNDGATTAGSPNILLDYPVITRYTINSPTQLSVSGYVSICSGNESTAGATIAGAKTIQFYKVADDGDQNGVVTGGVCTRVTSHGEGMQYLGSISGIVNSFSNQPFTLVSGTTFSLGDKLVAIAIDEYGNTSEFGATAIIADLSVNKTVNNTNPTVGSEVTFTITASNIGPDPASGVIVNDILPNGYTLVSATPSIGTWIAPNWNIGNLAVNATATLTIVARVNATGSYANTATISGAATQFDPVTSNNTSTVSITPFNPCIPTLNNLDSDGDGIADACDLDDDNDGILDKNECIGFIANNVTGSWKGRTISNITVSATPSTTQTNNQYITVDPQVNFSVNRNGGEQRFGVAATSVAYVLTFSTPVPANEVGLMIDDVNVATNQSPNATFKIDVDFGSGFVDPDGIFIKTLAGRNAGVSYNVMTGVPSFQDLPNPAGEDIYLKGIGNRLVKAVRITGTNLGNGDLIAYSFFALAKCDIDGDGIPNELDLDSDEDGCSDALEGAANILYGQLMTAEGTLSGGSTTVDKNICTTCVSTAGNNIGLPQFTTPPSGYSNATGQAAGEAYDSLANNCYCTKPGATGTPDGYTKVGISIQQKQAAWPENIPNGHIALESKTQGLVITRVAHVSFVPQPTDSIANPFAGMLVYDMMDECVKLFNGINWKCIARSCNYSFN